MSNLISEVSRLLNNPEQVYVSDLTQLNTPPLFKAGESVVLTEEWGCMDGKVGDEFIVESCISESLYVAMSNKEYYPLEYLKRK